MNCSKIKIISITIICLFFISNFSVISALDQKAIEPVTIPSNNLLLSDDDCDCPEPKISAFKELEPGDIMFKTVYTCLIYVHTLILKEYDEDLDKYLFVEASLSGVKTDYYDLEEISNATKYKFGRVITATELQKQNAILFAESQIGKKFQWDWVGKNFNPNDESDAYANEWYCSELIWAAYQNCDHHPDEQIFGKGINIDCNAGLNVKPRDIRNDLDVRVFYLKVDDGLKKQNQINPFIFNFFSKLLSYNYLLDLY